MTKPTAEQICDSAFQTLYQRGVRQDYGDFRDFAIIREDGFSLPPLKGNGPDAPHEFEHYLFGEDGQARELKIDNVAFYFREKERIEKPMYSDSTHVIPNSSKGVKPLGKLLEDKGYVTLSVNGKVVRVTRPHLGHVNSTTGFALEPQEAYSLPLHEWKRAEKLHVIYRGKDSVFVALGYWSFPYPEGPIKHHPEFLD